MDLYCLVYVCIYPSYLTKIISNKSFPQNWKFISHNILHNNKASGIKKRKNIDKMAHLDKQQRAQEKKNYVSSFDYLGDYLSEMIVD